MRRLLAPFCVGLFFMEMAPSPAQNFMPAKAVRLSCPPMPYVFDCSISRMPNPQFTSRCFYVAQGKSTLMRPDHRMGFSNEIVGLTIDAGMSVTGTVTENRTGQQGDCVEDDD